MSSIFDRSGVRHKKDKRKDQPALVISAPLGDVRHVSHIGRDGADFGEEHLFQQKQTRHSSPSKSQRQAYVNQHDSPIIKSAIPLHQAASIIKLDHKTESHDSGNYENTQILNLNENTNNGNINNNNNTLSTNTSSRLQVGLTPLTTNQTNGNTSTINSMVSSIASQGTGHIKIDSGLNPTPSIGHNNSVNLYPPGAPESIRVQHPSILGDGVSSSKQSMDSFSDVGSLDGMEEQGKARKEDDSTSLLGDVLAVMQLDKFANIPGNRSKYNKSELNGSLEELNSSQFTTKSDDGLVNNENNMEVISENSQEFEIGEMVISTTNTNNTSSSIDSRHSKRKPQKPGTVTHTKSLDCHTNQTSSIKSTNSAVRSLAYRNQSFQHSQKQLISTDSMSKLTNEQNTSRQPSVKLFPLKVSSESSMSADEIAL